MSLRSQILKGILEGCVLAIIEQQPTYGYELSLRLQENGLTDISEGSIYPILLRLQKEQLIKGTLQESETGPKRKYYSLTEKGLQALDDFLAQWNSIQPPVENILQKRSENS
ncbi:PadR family transcriptional regulator [Radiobacillus kanasensis]|uniref:PadR family transcriptional regulator n=1 Tax=Radiobacillus kanasensis TaxID=2844358 RepID=UPI001E65CF03|nr:PadR family transcriptional regulator [Radiobacillus kanasensis]UFT99800.1 PadR family transcriptional regulator [Radiobacillus kanasensis]